MTGCPVYMSELVGLGGPRAGSRLRVGPALGAHNPGVLHKNKAIQLRILYRPSLYRARSASKFSRVDTNQAVHLAQPAVETNPKDPNIIAWLLSSHFVHILINNSREHWTCACNYQYQHIFKRARILSEPYMFFEIRALLVFRLRESAKKERKTRQPKVTQNYHIPTTMRKRLITTAARLRGFDAPTVWQEFVSALASGW